MVVKVASLQPTLQDRFVRREVADQPVVRNFVKAASNVGLKNPRRRIGFGECPEELLDWVRRGPGGPEPIRVWTRRGFRDGLQREQIQRLLSSVDHARNSKGPHFCPIGLWDVNPPERTWPVATPFERPHCFESGLRG